MSISRTAARLSLLALGLTLALGASAATTGEVREAQRLLNALGYEAGPVDGVAGRRVEAAVRAFQGDMATTETGEVDATLLQALRRAMAPQAPAPLAPPPAVAVVASPPPPPPPEPSLTGQTWRFVDDVGSEMTLTFRRNERVTGPAYAEGFAWRQDGDDLWLTYESPLGGRVVRQGRLAGPDAMTGDGQSVDGPGAEASARAWSWRAEKIR